MRSVGIVALAIELPKGERTNQYYKNQFPELVREISEKKSRMFEARPAPTDEFDAQMAKYFEDPFKGTVARRVLTAGENALSLEQSAARKAIASANLQARDIDLLIVASFLPDQMGAQNAAYLAKELGLTSMAFNVESACSGSMVGFHTACALVASGQYKNALVVTSCTYTRDTDPSDPLSFNVGDGAAAFLVAPVKAGLGRLGGKSVHTAATCGAVWYQNYQRPDGSLWFRLQASRQSGKLLQDSATRCLLECCEGALADAGVELSKIDAFVFNTPFAWYTEFCSRTLGIDVAKAIDTHPFIANVGPVLMPINLYYMAKQRPLREGDLVLMYSIGSVSSASAAVLRWSEAALGPEPDPAQQNCD